MPYRNGTRVPWLHKVDVSDVFHDEEMAFEQRRELIVQRLRDSGVFTDRDGEIEDTLWELGETRHEDEFDAVWQYVYDFADKHLIWIETMGVPA